MKFKNRTPRKTGALLLAAAMLAGLVGCAAPGAAEPPDSEPSAGIFLSGGNDTAPEEGPLPMGAAVLTQTVEPEENQDLEPEESRGAPVRQSVTALVDGTHLAGEAYLYREALEGEHRELYDLIRDGLRHGAAEIVMTLPVTVEECMDIYRSVYYDSPDLFWVDTSYKLYKNKKGVVTRVVPGYFDLAGDIGAHRKKVEEAFAEPLADLWSLKDDAARVKYAHDYLLSTLTYQAEAPYAQSLYSAAVGKKTVCTGYARAFQYLMQKVGIPCAFLMGTARSGEVSGAHAWNLVRLNGEFYVLDVTWDDPLNRDDYKYTYFNLTDTQMSADHTRDARSARLPAANGTALSFEKAYAGQYGTDFSAVQGVLPQGYGAEDAYVGDAEPADNPYLP